MNSDSFIAVARIIKPFKLRGGVKLHLLASPDEIKTYKQFYIEYMAEMKELNLESLMGYRQNIASFKEINNRDEAEELRNKYLFIDKNRLLKKNNVNEFYAFELVGMKVFENDRELGKLTDMQELSGRWYMKVKGEKEFLVPFVSAFVRNIDMKSSTVHISLIDGLRDL